VQYASSFTEGDGPLKNVLHVDRSSDVKWVVATQNPMDLRTKANGYGPIQQCRFWTWCGPLKTWHEGFLDGNGMSNMKGLMPTENYEYVVIDPTASLPPGERILHRGQTDPQFG